MTQHDAGPVSVSGHLGCAVVTLDDPDRRNVLSPPRVDALCEAFRALEADGETRCVVLTGAGTSFCAGAELDVLARASSGNFDGVEHVYRAFLTIAESPLPTIAVVNGPAVGAGLNLALAANLRLAVRGAVFDSRFVTLGLAPGGGHTWMLERLVGADRRGGHRAARAWLLSRRRVCRHRPQAAGRPCRACGEPATGLDRDAGEPPARRAGTVAAMARPANAAAPPK